MQRTRTGKFRSQPKDPVTGRRLSITADTPTAVSARLARIGEVRLDLQLGGDPLDAARKLRPAAGRLLTLQDAWDRYRSTLSPRRQVKADENWRRYLARLLPPEIRIWELTDERLARWHVELERVGARALSTRSVAYSYLAAAVGLLVPRELAALPWGSWRPPRPDRDEVPAAARSKEELFRLLQAAGKYDAEHPPASAQLAVIVAIATGARSAELAGLGWDCLELESDPPLCVLRYQAPRDWRRWCEGRPTLPRKGGRKGSKAVTIRLPDLAVRALQIQRARLLAANHYRHDGPVFPGRAGAWRTSGSVLKGPVVREIARTAGLPDWRRWRPHAFRHTLGTIGFRESGDLRVVQSLLGHADVRTSERYAHRAGRGLPPSPLPALDVELPSPPPAALALVPAALPEPELPALPPALPAGEEDLCLTFAELARRWHVAHPAQLKRPRQVTRAADQAYRRAWLAAKFAERPGEEARAEGRAARGRVLGAWGTALAREAPGARAGRAKNPRRLEP